MDKGRLLVVGLPSDDGIELWGIEGPYVAYSLADVQMMLTSLETCVLELEKHRDVNDNIIFGARNTLQRLKLGVPRPPAVPVRPGC